MLGRGETLGLVGESGSGKSTVGHMILRLTQPDSGQIRVGGIDIAPLTRLRELRPFRRRTQLVFQDPCGSLNPRRRIVDAIAAGLIAQGASGAEAMVRARAFLSLVGLDPSCVHRHPHQFSGGQRQRIAIARALALQPEVLVADEPVSALDVTVQEQVLGLLADLRERLGLAMVFITHDLRVAAPICDRVAVMKSGEIVEIGAAAAVLDSPAHPYAREFLAAAPGQGWLPTRTANPVARLAANSDVTIQIGALAD